MNKFKICNAECAQEVTDFMVNKGKKCSMVRLRGTEFREYNLKMGLVKYAVLSLAKCLVSA